MKAAVVSLIASYVILMVGTLAQVPPPLPQREATTITDLFDSYGRCQSQLVDEQRYEDKLIARIRELEKENASLKEAITAGEK